MLFLYFADVSWRKEVDGPFYDDGKALAPRNEFKEIGGAPEKPHERARRVKAEYIAGRLP